MGESDAHRIFDSIGQGSFGATFASSLNIGTAIYREILLELGRYCEVKYHPGPGTKQAKIIGETLAKKVKLRQNELCPTWIKRIQGKDQKRG